MGLNVTVTANEAFADGATVDRAALRRAAKPTVSITGAVSAAEVGAESIDNTKLAHMAANTVKVRDASTTGDPSDKVVGDTQILIGDGTGFTAAALSGDVTMANTGAVTIAANAVEGSMLNTNAADGTTIEVSSNSLSLKADSVGITHLANGTAGTLISYDATGAVAAVGAGTAGHILTANASGVPTFQANTGAMKLLAYSQSTTTHTPSTANPASISTITLPANHGFSHVMIQADIRAIKQGNETTADLGLYVGGSKVKDFPFHEDPANTDTIVETPITTLTFITDGNQTSDTTIAMQKFGAGNDYLVTFHGWRIWGLTAP
jgi:hypothetical protein